MWSENTAHITAIYECIAAVREITMELFAEIFLQILYQLSFSCESVSYIGIILGIP